MMQKSTLNYNKNYLKNFIDKFYVSPSWQNLPTGFPNCDLKGLTKEEQRLFDGVVLSWQVNTKEGRSTIYKDIVRKTIVSIVIVFGIFAADQLNLHNKNGLATPVNAATVSATLRQINIKEQLSRAVESTFSGVLKNH